MVLVQGVGVVGNGWRPQAESLSLGYTVITIDNRGIGRSTLDGRQLTVEDPPRPRIPPPVYVPATSPICHSMNA